MEPGGLWWTNVLNLALPPQRHRPDTQSKHKDPVSQIAQKKREGKKERKKEKNNKVIKIESKKYLLKIKRKLNSNKEKDSRKEEGASLVAQWLRICLPMQGMRVRALVWEDPTCHGTTRPMSHSY